MEKLHYLAILERAKNGGFGVYFPDLPGCVTMGDAEFEAWENAESALNLHVAGIMDDGEVLPAPTPPSKVKRDPEVDEVARLLIAVQPTTPKVRVNVMLDANVVRAIDRVCDNRSQFIGAAATAMLQAGAAPVARTSQVRRRRRIRVIPAR